MSVRSSTEVSFSGPQYLGTAGQSCVVDESETSLLPMSVDERVSAACFDKVLLFLCRGKPISPEELGEEVLKVSARGHHKSVSLLLGEGREVSQVHLREAFQDAAKKGYYETVSVLLNGMRPFYEETLKRGHWMATKNGNHEVAAVIAKTWRNYRYPSSQGAATQPMRRFVFLPNITSFKDLETPDKVALQFVRLEAVLSRMRVKKLISSEDLGEAVKMASAWGRYVTVSELLRQGTVSQKDLGIAVKLSATWHDEVLKVLLSEGRTISPEDLVDAVVVAQVDGDGRSVRLLLSEGRLETLFDGEQVVNPVAEKIPIHVLTENFRYQLLVGR